MGTKLSSTRVYSRAGKLRQVQAHKHTSPDISRAELVPRKCIFLKSISAILWDVAWVYRTEAAVHDRDLVIELTDSCDKSLQLKDGHLLLSCFAERLTD